MSQSEFSKWNASDYIGIDGLSSSTEPDSPTVARAVNYECSVGHSIRGRLGHQIAGSPGGFFGIFPYNYNRTQDQYDVVYQTPSGVHPAEVMSQSTVKTAADGATIAKLIAINQQLWTLATWNYTITRVSGAYPFTYYTTVSGGTIHFIVKANGVTILDVDCGTGLNTTDANVFSLLNSIDATAELAISRTTRGTCPPYAISNANQTATLIGLVPAGYGRIYSVTYSTGNFQRGDIITFPTNPLVAGVVYDVTTANTIKYVGPQVTIANGDILGVMGQCAAAIPIGPAISFASGNLTLSVPYWKNIPEGDASLINASPVTKDFGACFKSGLTIANAKSASSSFVPPTAISAQGNLYIASSSEASLGAIGYANSLMVTDGLTVRRSGVASGPDVALGAIGAGGALNGIYKYKAVLRRYDGQGNIWESPTRTIATSAALVAQHIAVSALDVLYTDMSGWQQRSAYKATAEAPAANASFLIDDGAGAYGFIQPGDPVHLLDNVAQKAGLAYTFGGAVVGTIHRTVCTAYDGVNNSIRVADSSGYTIPDNAPISTGLDIVILRTTGGGNLYYELATIPYVGIAGGGVAFDDNVSDTVLAAGVQYQEVTLGKEHNPPPSCSIVCMHQGGLVVARGTTGSLVNAFYRTIGPNTIAFSTADGIEYFPTASNSFELPSNISSSITAIASDTADRLAVFKERAYYDIQGDLDGGAFSVNVITEGDYGVPSPASIVRVGDYLVGLSKIGFLLIQNGGFSAKPFDLLNTRLINQAYQFNWATAVNDPFNRQYICTIPIIGASPIAFVVNYSDSVLKPKTFERSWASTHDAAYGHAFSGESSLYHLSASSPFAVFKRNYRFNGDSPNGTNGDSFIDNTVAINYVFETQPIALNQPSLYKTPIRVRVFSIPNNYVFENWVTFSMLLETAAAADAGFIGSPNLNAQSSTITFAAATSLFKDVVVPPVKTFFYILRLTTNTIKQCPFLTGYEVAFKLNYQKDDLQP